MSDQRTAREARVRELIALVLGQPLIESRNPTRATEPGWDSIKHLELVFALEDAFGVRFSEEEMAALDGCEAIVASLERHLEA